MKELVIIGAGPGGFDAAVFAKEKGLDVALIEKDKIGGTCLNHGCIPTKALYHASILKSQIKEASLFGLGETSDLLDFNVLRNRKEDVVTFQSKNMMSTIKKLGIDYIEGKATIIDNETVKVNNQIIKTKNIIIATGSKPKNISLDDKNLKIIVDSQKMLKLEKFPQKLVVIGAGVIGLEMASIFHEFGSSVTIVEYEKNVLPSFDSDIVKRVANLMKRKGVKILTSSMFKEVIVKDGKSYALVETKKGEILIETDQVLIAVGREAEYGDLPLEKLGIEFSRSGIKVNDYKQTSIPNIYAIGDVNGELMLAHKATYDGYKAVSHILGKDMKIRFDLVPSVVFTKPEIASVGKTEDNLEKGTYKTAKYMYRTNAKAQCMNETDGFIKIIVDKNEMIIGCHIIGAHASDLIHEVAAMMNQNTKVSEYINVIHAHPTLSEIIGECLKQIV